MVNARSIQTQTIVVADGSQVAEAELVFYVFDGNLDQRVGKCKRFPDPVSLISKLPEVPGALHEDKLAPHVIMKGHHELMKRIADVGTGQNNGGAAQSQRYDYDWNF
ncbi:unnamed protein product [Cylicostephanus goldi]|uniref:Uncharacterized protein n=1 Tax=Cylicostephanus goldi TaxID=71465 RepID=A0A3P6TAK5_CYLGO|nr:unnamed protein product [Cylicostephanus goldi]